jgi:hypothetical protein
MTALRLSTHIDLTWANATSNLATTGMQTKLDEPQLSGSGGNKLIRLLHGQVILGVLMTPAVGAPMPPSAAEIAAYQDLRLVAARGTAQQRGKRSRRALSQM